LVFCALIDTLEPTVEVNAHHELVKTVA